jgi:hypothetical protein
MNWRHWFGLKPTEADLAHKLLLTAKATGNTGWIYNAVDSTLRSGEQVINLANIHCEYAQAPRKARPALLQKYHAMLAPAPQAQVTNLWTLAQTRIFPILRSRYERVALEIEHRRSAEPFPPRAAQPYLSHLDIVIGYDHGQTISQVKASTAAEWGVTLDDIIDDSYANLRALPTPTWEPVGNSVWKLESEGGYTESFLQLPKTFDQFPAQGTPLAMIPNRGVLLATGADELGGLAALLGLARHSIEQGPWPLCGDLFRVAQSGVELFTPDGPTETLLAAIRKLDIAGAYAAQKTALEAHCAVINDDVYVATYGLLGKKDAPDDLQSWCSWTEGVPTLLPTTDSIAFVWDLNNARKTALVPWVDAERLVGHYFKSTTEDPPRTRVDVFPTQPERTELEKAAALAASPSPRPAI